DAMAGVNYLKSRKEIDHERIGLIGHSEGSMIAPMVAVQTPNVAFIVLIASPGLAIKEMEYSKQARDLKEKGARDDLIAKERTVLKSLFEVIMQETDSAAVMERFNTIIRESFERLSEEESKIKEISEQNLEANIHDQFQRLHSSWFRFYLPYDPGTVLRRITCPVIALNGEKDVQVPAKENLQAIKMALEAGGNKNYTIKELPDLNHLLQTAETGSISEYGKIEETMSPTALQIIGDWILEQTSQGKTKDKSNFPVLKGPYLGQNSPSLTPEVFALGIVSTTLPEFSCCVSPDAKEIYFTRWIPKFRSSRIMFTHLTDTGWTKPDILPQIIDIQTLEPTMSPDGSKLFFGVWEYAENQEEPNGQDLLSWGTLSIKEG
ncbi:MAG: hypothetical protein GQ476_02750, partial [Candidatus Aminicenantes bacterium]|nr:hypothetical protein [Candidatus Aminicenantes bacterium]